MAYIIDETYFIRELLIPNESEIDVSSTANPFSNWIDTESRLMLKNALGFVLFADFDTNIDVNGMYVPGVTKWDNLVNGVTYTFKGDTYRFEGLILTEGTVKRSMLAYYVYAKWLPYFMSQLTGMGEQHGSTVNSIISDAGPRQSKAWNNFTSLYNGDVSIWQIVSGINVERIHQNNRFSSLLKFLLHNETDYPEAALIVERSKNRFSI